MKNNFGKYFAEALGTFAIVFFGCGAVMISERFPGSIPNGGVAVIFGIVVAIMIYALGHISCAHFNPAVTFAFAITEKFPKKEVLPYFVSQFFGAIIASTLLYFLLPNGSTFGVTLPHPDLDLFQAFIWEVILTFFLMTVIISVATDARAAGIFAGLAIGLTVALDAFIGGSLTGASMNPARSFAPALISKNFKALYIYLTAPFIGAALGAFFYEYIKCHNDNEDESAKGDASGCC